MRKVHGVPQILHFGAPLFYFILWLGIKCLQDAKRCKYFWQLNLKLPTKLYSPSGEFILLCLTAHLNPFPAWKWGSGLTTIQYKLLATSTKCGVDFRLRKTCYDQRASNEMSEFDEVILSFFFNFCSCKPIYMKL